MFMLTDWAELVDDCKANFDPALHNSLCILKTKAVT